MHAFDIALRGGAGVLLLLLAGLLARDYGRTWAARLGAAFALGAAVFAVSSTAGFRVDGSPWRTLLMALSTGDNVVFWLFARALFDDGFRPRAWCAVLWGGVVCAVLACGLVLRPMHSPLAAPLDGLLAGVSLAFAGLAVVQTVASWSADLVERRRRLRVAVVGAAAGYIALNAIVDLTGLQTAAPEIVSLVGGAGLAAIAAGVAWSFLGVAGGDALFLPQPAKRSGAAAIDLSHADRKLLAAIERAMQVDRVYRRDGLTIGGLAAMHAAPDHRLRRLINQGLGFRNFNAFVNSYRIADARSALEDPGQTEVPILTIALDAGFSSLGPFNRAFKLETGRTPSEYRKAALGRPSGGAAIAILAGRIQKSA